MKKLKYLALLLLVAAVAGCGQKREKLFDLGTIENGVYHNEYIGFSITVPDSMTARDHTTLNQLTEASYELLNMDSRTAKKSLDIINYEALLMINSNRMDQGDFSPNILVSVENMRMFPHVKNTGDYLAKARKDLRAALKVPTEIDDENPTVVLGGREFRKLTMMSDYGMWVTQECYVTMIDRLVLGIYLTYASEESGAQLRDVLESIRFDE
ncbi:hypothetical protein LJC45_01395 [Alistipes sp. OttesenSCG-928-B03]|nr:hypothetical protein [Alistipes sp. OttesenSCG-928-B03]